VIAANLLQAIGLLPLLLVHSADQVWIVYVVGATLSVVDQFLGPADNALLPMVVAEEDLVSANSLNSVRQNAGRLVGPALGGLVAAIGGVGMVAIIDAVSFVIAALLTVFVTAASVSPREAEPGAAVEGRAFLHELTSGLELARRDGVVSVLTLSRLVTGVGEGVMGVMFVIWVRLMLHGGALQIGWFMSAQAVGGLLGGIAVAHLGRRLSPLPWLGAASIVFALLDIALFSYPLATGAVAPGLVLIALVGLPAALFGACWMTLVQTRVTDEYRGRIFGVVNTFAGLGLLVGTLGAGVIGGLAGPVLMLNVFQGGGYLLTGAFILGVVLIGGRAARLGAPAMARKEA
jgi:Na+/melibiose symporter-like transporter